MSRTCKGERITIGEGSNVLDEARASGVDAPDFFEKYAAATIDPAKAEAMAVTASYTVDGQALLWIVDDSVVVDATVFPDGLQVVEVTTAAARKPTSLGTIAPGALEELGMASLAEFLMHARVVGTWIHIGAEMCPIPVPDDARIDDAQVVAYAGTHTYFTNEENVDEVAFILRVSKHGAIEVEAR